MNQDASFSTTASRQSPSQGYISTGSDSKPKSSSSSHKRASRAGTRSVTTLSAAQLERKRANDREAQRAIRQRTKDHIETLECRINELTATHESREKSMVVTQQRNRELEDENAYLRSRIGNETFAINIANTDTKEKPSDQTSSPQTQLAGSSIPRPSSTSTSRSVPLAPLHTPQHPDSWRNAHAFTPAGGPTPTTFLSDTTQTTGAPSPVSWRSQDVSESQARMEQSNRSFVAGPGAPERGPWVSSTQGFGYQMRPHDRTASFPSASQPLPYPTSQPPPYQTVAVSQSEPTPASATFHTPTLVPHADYPHIASYHAHQQTAFHEQPHSHPAYQVNPNQVSPVGDFRGGGSTVHRGSLAPPGYHSPTGTNQFTPIQPNHGQGLAFRTEGTGHQQYGYEG